MLCALVWANTMRLGAAKNMISNHVFRCAGALFVSLKRRLVVPPLSQPHLIHAAILVCARDDSSPGGGASLALYCGIWCE